MVFVCAGGVEAGAGDIVVTGFTGFGAGFRPPWLLRVVLPVFTV
jgi:hypothetical protein